MEILVFGKRISRGMAKEIEFARKKGYKIKWVAAECVEEIKT